MEKEFNPALQFDAFTAGVEEGGLRSTYAVSMIACYILANSKEKITAKHIVDTMVEGKIANYFEISDAVSKLVKNGNFIQEEDGTLTITDECKKAIEIVEKDLPYSVRDKSIELSRKILIREIFKKENKVDIKKSENTFFVTMHVSGKNADLMTLTLSVPTETQAQVIKEKFQENPVTVYESLIDSIFSEK